MSFPYKVVRHEKSHESAEDYLENILILRERNGNVRSIDIVNEMNYSKPSVSRAIKLLRANRYINVDKNGFITLTKSGREIQFISRLAPSQWIAPFPGGPPRRGS